MIIVKVDFDRDYFQSVLDKMNHYKDYYKNELLSRANSEEILYIVITTIPGLFDP